MRVTEGAGLRLVPVLTEEVLIPSNAGNPGRAARPGAAPAGTRPRDLRSSYITLPGYEGVPLTTISKEVGTSMTMIERHYAGVIENWDGQRIPAEAQIRAARATGRRGMDVLATERQRTRRESPCKFRSGRSRTRTWDLFLIREAL